MKTFLNITKWFFIILISCIIYVCIHFFIGRVILKKQFPLLFGYSYMSVEEVSFDGKYQLGDLLLVKKQDRYEVGDYVIYTSGEGIQIEMITQLTDNGYMTVSGTKDLVKKERQEAFILVKIAAPIASIGKGLNFLTSTAGIFVVLVLFAMFMFFQMK